MSAYTVFRSGYTGEDGVEIILPAQAATGSLKSLSSGLCQPDSIIQPAGLGARDTLRLEAAMPLYGHELSEGTDPISAGLDWAVDLKKEFIGVEPLRVIAEEWPGKKTRRPGIVRPAHRPPGVGRFAPGRPRRRSHQRNPQPHAAKKHRHGLR